MKPLYDVKALLNALRKSVDTWEITVQAPAERGPALGEYLLDAAGRNELEYISGERIKIPVELYNEIINHPQRGHFERPEGMYHWTGVHLIGHREGTDLEYDEWSLGSIESFTVILSGMQWHDGARHERGSSVSSQYLLTSDGAWTLETRYPMPDGVLDEVREDVLHGRSNGYVMHGRGHEEWAISYSVTKVHWKERYA